MARPNLFDYATSELSQDAVLCWLAAWARPNAASEDERLHELGVRFIAALFEAHGKPAPEISSLKVERQCKRIDVLLIINEQTAVCIEDKKGSLPHSDQLARYVEDLTARSFARADVVPIYVQTSEQSSFAAVREAGYAPVLRKQLLAILQPYVRSADANAIACDFYRHLKTIDDEVESFNTLPLADWKWFAWQGFYQYLRGRLTDGTWGYVANPRNGFQGFWWRTKEDQDCMPYLQIEEEKLCFKVEVKRPEERDRLRTRWRERLMEASAADGLTRPRRLGNGRTMTVAVLDNYRIADDEGRIDLDATVKRLRTAEAILDSAVGDLN